MEVYFSYVDWNEAEARAIQGTLEDDMVDAEEGAWIEVAEFEDVLSVTFLLGAACDAVFPNCTSANRNAIDRSFGRFMTEESDQWSEISGKLDPETFWLALSPTTVTEILAACSEVDYDDLKNQFEQTCPERIRKDLGYSGDDYIGHLKEWENIFAEAAAKKRGLLVTAG